MQQVKRERDFGFNSDPRLRMLVSGKDWQVLRALGYVEKDGTRNTIPRGFYTDLASIPRLLQWLVPVHGKHSPAAIWHDLLYATQQRSRAASDRSFLEAMESLDVRFVRRYVMYFGVRIGGWWAWGKRKRWIKRDLAGYLEDNGLVSLKIPQ